MGLHFVVTHSLNDLLDDVGDLIKYAIVFMGFWIFLIAPFLYEMMFVCVGPYWVMTGLPTFSLFWIKVVVNTTPIWTTALVIIVAKLFEGSSFDRLPMAIIYGIFALNLWFIPACTSRDHIRAHSYSVMNEQERKTWKEWYEKESEKAEQKRVTEKKKEKVEEYNKKQDDIADEMERQRLERVRKAKEKFRRSTQTSGD